jgi:hypothetical protein
MKPHSQSLFVHFKNLLNYLPALPGGVEWLLPLDREPETGRVFQLFLEKYYADDLSRTLLLGINPGRFGAGITNVAFTDPAHLLRECGIDSHFDKREEISAQFVYKVIRAFGGVEVFYRGFFINSVVPFGFVKDGKNYNYYDDKTLQSAVEPFALRHIRGLLDCGMNRRVCFCLGEGKNFKFLEKLNQREGFFGKIIPLAHPRFIMQYKRRLVDDYVQDYLSKLRER